MEGSLTNHNQQGGQIVQNQNNPMSDSKRLFSYNNLFDAILYGDLDNVMRCIKRGALINQSSKGTEITALHLAVACGNVTIVQLLLERGADVRRRDKKGREAVHIAAALGNPEMLGLLIDNSCDVNSVVAAVTSNEADTGELTFEIFNMVDHTAKKMIPIMEIGDTPLSLAASRNHKECVILLIERGAKIILDDTIDYNASFSRNTVLAHYIIDMLKDGVGSRLSTTPVVIRGGEEFKLSMTCLHEAIEQEYLPLIGFLVDFDPCQLIQEKDGSYPLHRLVLKKLLKPLEHVLAKRNEPQIRDIQGYIGCTPLYIAVHNQWLPGVIVLLKAGADVTLYPKDRETVLHLAAGSCKLEILEEFLKSSKSGEILDTKDNLGCTPLCLTVRRKWLPGVKALLEAGADVTLYSKYRHTVLHLAAILRQSEILEELLNSNKSGEIRDVQDYQGCTALYLAVEKQWLKGVKALLKAGADVTIYPKDGPTVLHKAASFRNHEILDELLNSSKSGEILDALNYQGCTPLYLAVRRERLPGVKALLKAGADVTLYPEGGPTVMHLAAKYRQSEILEKLLNYSTKSKKVINMLNDSQETPLCSAVRAGQPHNVELLLYKGADLYFKLPGDRTLLHLAAEEGCPDILRYLIFVCDELSIINYSDINGLTALHVAALNGSKSCVDVLINNRCDVDKKTKDHYLSGSTPLHLAAEKGHKKVVERIICHKIDTLNTKNANNYIPLQIAAMSNNKECIRVMLLNGANLGATVTDEFGDEVTALEFIVNNVDNAAEFLKDIFDQCKREYVNLENRLNKSTIMVNYGTFRPSSYDNQLRVLESFFNCENEDVERNLLLHPVVQTRIYVNSKKYMFFFFAMIALQMTYAVSLTLMAMYLYTTESQTTFVNNSVFICRCTLSASLLLIILLELILASRKHLYHFKNLESWVRWTMILLSLLVLVGDHPADWLVVVSTVAVLLSWIELFFQISQWHSFPKLYVLMFIAVMKNKLKVLATFFFVILGYVLAFIIYFEKKDHFAIDELH